MFDLHEQFGDIDIYLFDQLLKGRIATGMRILDAGCGDGRNLVYLLRQGYEIFGVDAEAHAIESVRSLAASLAPLLPAGNFRVEAVEKMSFPDAFADVAISSAVLHFARDDQQFQRDGPANVEGSQAVADCCSAGLPPRLGSRTGSNESPAAAFGCPTARSVTWWTRRC